MQQNVSQMVSPRIQLIKLTIQHVRDGGERMPVRRMNVGKSPPDPVERETVRDFWIFVNVFVVVVVDELVPKRLAEGDPNYGRQENADDTGDYAVTENAIRARCS